jgi:uncharacterized protein (TIGR02996 family)
VIAGDAGRPLVSFPAVCKARAVTGDAPALLRAVLDDPEDIATRRVYADALIAEDDPRGELIQVQCDLAECTPGEPRWAALLAREGELLAKHGKEWMAPFKSFLFRLSFQRGMIEDAWVHSKKFVPVAGTLLEREPVTALSMRGLTQANAAVLGARPELRRLRSLLVAESRLGVRGVEALFGEHMVKLRALNLYQGGVDDAGLAHLGTTLFPQLERLNVSGTRITYTGLERLLRDPRLTRLGYLGLMWLVPVPAVRAISRRTSSCRRSPTSISDRRGTRMASSGRSPATPRSRSCAGCASSTTSSRVRARSRRSRR